MRARILVAVVCVPLLFVLLYFLPPVATALLIAALCAVGAYEMLRTVGAGSLGRLVAYTAAAAALIPLGVLFLPEILVLRAVLILLMCFIFAEGVAAAIRERAFPVLYLFAAIFAGVVIPVLLSSLVKLRQMENGRLYVLVPFIVAFITDGGAYFVGIAFGKRHIFPHVSPKKSLEGCVGGIATVIAASALYGVILKYAAGLHPDFFALCLYGLLGGVATELGDLAFSLIKREFGVKDYGNLLPGHGGILDRFDSMIFAAPVLYLLAALWPAF